MFKNITIYQFKSPSEINPADLGEVLSRNAFVPCGATQQQSFGWVEPHHDGVFVEVVKSQLIMKLMIETKKVPSDVLDRALQEQIDHIEATTGRKLGKKERRELKDEITLSLLPQAFPQRKAAFLWIDREYGRIVVGSASSGVLDIVCTALINALDGVVIQLLSTENSVPASMASWVSSNEYPEHFIGTRELELKASDESKAVVKYKNHAIDIDEVRNHIQQGKAPVKLGMNYADRVDFTLTPELQIKGIKILDIAFEGADDEQDAFFTDAFIQTEEIGALIDSLCDALGGVNEIATQE